MKPTNVNLAAQGQILYQLYPNVRLKALPFYEVIAEIQRPTLLRKFRKQINCVFDDK